MKRASAARAGLTAVADTPVGPGEMRDGMTPVTGDYGKPDGQGKPVLFEGVDHVPRGHLRTPFG
ncbi:hypothetical protein GCM10010415_30840 [Streptomyces atrovirens]|uniref:Uncharacterized protein n=1 Tax=Streptomyces atrovirens TaxID=285556 RepID=A0ABW0DT01_9ACTN